MRILLFFLARDRYAPVAFLRMGDRLAFTNGIAVLAGAAVLLYVVFAGRTDRLIPLYAVGVFLAFTLSQSGMVAHWLRRRGRAWRRSMAFNATGAALSAMVLLVEALTKFTEGAWIVVLLIPAIVLTLRRVNRHYRDVKQATRLRALPSGGAPAAFVPRTARLVGAPVAPEHEEVPDQIRPMCVVPVQALDLPNLRALAYAASLRQPTLALHVSSDEEEAQAFLHEWRAFGDHLPLEVISSPYRAIVPPLVHYLGALHSQRPDLTITVVFSELVVERAWQRVLHEHTARRIGAALREQPNTIITAVPFHLRGLDRLVVGAATRVWKITMATAPAAPREIATTRSSMSRPSAGAELVGGRGTRAPSTPWRRGADLRWPGGGLAAAGQI